MLAEPRRPLSLTAAPHALRCSRARAYALLLRHFPILAWLPRYPVRDWLLGDVLSGLSVAIMQLPQGELLAGPSPGSRRGLRHPGPQPRAGTPSSFLCPPVCVLTIPPQAWPTPSWLDCLLCSASTAPSTLSSSTSCLALPGTSLWVSGVRPCFPGGPPSAMEDRVRAG